MNTPTARPPPKVALRTALLAHLAGDLREAEAGYRLAMADRGLAEAARFHLVRLLGEAGRWGEALERQRELVEARPDKADYRLGLAQILLLLGRYEEAWPHYEARRAKQPRPGPPTDDPEWDGADVGSLVVLDEEGAGDSIQFLRFLPLLQARGIDVTFVGRSGLVGLVEEMGVRAVAGEGLARTPAADGWVMLGSLGWRLGVSLETLSSAPYLRAPPDRRDLWTRRLGPGLEIGIVHTGNRQQGMNPHRTLPPEGQSFLENLPGAVPLIPGVFPLPLRDFADTAAIIERLKLVITVDTAVAHLTGALGKPCWLLLTSAYRDWRWMLERTDSPWYGSMRIYRQPKPGDWASVLRAVAADLPDFLKSAS